MAKWWERAYLNHVGAHYYGGVVDDLDYISPQKKNLEYIWHENIIEEDYY